MIILEKDLQALIDKNSILDKENERLKRELSSVSALHKKVGADNNNLLLITNKTHLFTLIQEILQKMVTSDNNNLLLFTDKTH